MDNRNTDPKRKTSKEWIRQPLKMIPFEVISKPGVVPIKSILESIRRKGADFVYRAQEPNPYPTPDYMARVISKGLKGGRMSDISDLGNLLDAINNQKKEVESSSDMGVNEILNALTKTMAKELPDGVRVWELEGESGYYNKMRRAGDHKASGERRERYDRISEIRKVIRAVEDAAFSKDFAPSVRRQTAEDELKRLQNEFESKTKGSTIQQEDAWRKFLGIPQVGGTMKESDYKPTRAKDSNVTYYTNLSNADKKETLFYINQKIKFHEKNNDDLEFPFVTKGGNRGGIGNYTVDKGRDKYGDYYSIYDIYDFSVKGESIGNKYEIYDRIYINGPKKLLK